MHGTMLLALALLTPAREKPADSRAEIIGAWRGESKCMVRPSPCNDEIAYYVVRAAEGKADRISVEGDKIVKGTPVQMGTFECGWDAAKHTARCDLPNSTLLLVISGKEMNGSLTQSDGRLYRRMHLMKEKSGS